MIAVEADGHENDGAGDGLLPERGYAKQIEGIGDDAEKQRAEHGAPDLTDAARKRYAADNDRGDGGQRPIGGAGRLTDVGLSEENDAYNGCEQAAKCVGDQKDTVDVDA